MASRRAKQERLKQKQQVDKTTKHKQYQDKKDNVFVLFVPLGHLFVVVTRKTNVFVLSVPLGHLFVVVKN